MPGREKGPRALDQVLPRDRVRVSATGVAGNMLLPRSIGCNVGSSLRLVTSVSSEEACRIRIEPVASVFEKKREAQGMFRGPQRDSTAASVTGLTEEVKKRKRKATLRDVLVEDASSQKRPRKNPNDDDQPGSSPTLYTANGCELRREDFAFNVDKPDLSSCSCEEFAYMFKPPKEMEMEEGPDGWRR